MIRNVLKEIADKCEDEAEWAQGELEKMAKSYGYGYDGEDRAWMAGWLSAHEGILNVARREVM